MELRQLTYFEAVARHGGFTRAAQHLHVAQSAISAQVRALESELGVDLFTRTTRAVVLTRAGELFLGRARRILGEVDGARGELAALSGVLAGRVTIGATPVLGGIDLPRVLSDFHGRFPGVALSLRSGLIAALLAKLDDGAVDLVLGPIHDDLDRRRHVARRIAREQLVLVVPERHRLAAKTRIKPIDVRREPFICLPEGSGLRALLDTFLGAAAEVPFEAGTPEAVRDLVAAGLGVALLARSSAERPGAPVAVLGLDPAPAHPPIGIIRRRDRRLTAAADVFVQASFP